MDLQGSLTLARAVCWIGFPRHSSVGNPSASPRSTAVPS